MACCVFAAYLFGLLWRSVRAVTVRVGAVFGRLPPAEDVVAPGAVRTVVIPRELREAVPHGAGLSRATSFQ